MDKIEITYLSQTYILDLNRAKELGVIKPKTLYSIGQKFHQKYNNSTYILAHIGDEATRYLMTLIEINSGRRWNEGSCVNNLNAITPEELAKIMGHDKEFTLIES
jgi:hypothetical protein